MYRQASNPMKNRIAMCIALGFSTIITVPSTALADEPKISTPEPIIRYGVEQPLEQAESRLIASRYYKYIGNGFSGKFHRPSCPFAKVMGRSHRIFFRFRRDAIESTFVPCRYCLPPTWKSVSCKLLSVESRKDVADKSVEQLHATKELQPQPRIPDAQPAPAPNFGQ